MFLAAKTIRFFRKHTGNIFHYSKQAAVASFSIFAYSISTILLVLTGIVYIAEPPTELIAIAIDLFLASPPLSVTIALFSAIIYKIRLLSYLSYIDPHDQHPVLDFLSGGFLFTGGFIGFFATIGYFENITSAGASEGVDILIEILILIGVASIIMFFAAVTANGGSRIISNSLSALLAIRKIRKLPEILYGVYQHHLHRLRLIINTYRVISIYATKNNISTYRAAIQIFKYGMEQIEPIDHSTVHTATENYQKDPQ
ncbi:hypothetical protein SAMN06269185_0944 [Natronoarchaeum philippinense]|uniref:Uncharacterized protein n=1 Tax=Natronoarchaeum philippinense TaxID=558529 RepID=A0A285NA25_NATPI|nr:hypothetical protein [Natronoarchaeum philippinense]SNZ05767.1 hypothetical protein SAMN06269185_0944 [Natronoarchaeum philippinense]